MRALILIVSSFIGLGMSAWHPAFAAEYGAIAYDAGAGRWGDSWHAPTIAGANSTALNACGTSGCNVVIDIGPALCGALATAPNPAGWGAASRSTRALSEASAVVVCQAHNVGACKLQVSDCNQ